MGISGALLEEIVYDETGQNRSGSFADYLVATAVEIPPIEVISHTRLTDNADGSKGMAEGGVMGAVGRSERRQRRAGAVRRRRERQPLSPAIFARCSASLRGNDNYARQHDLDPEQHPTARVRLRRVPGSYRSTDGIRRSRRSSKELE